MLRIYSLLFLIFFVSLQTSAQCGTYFKETNRQVFSNSFAYSYIKDFDNDGLNDLFGYSLTAPGNYQIYFYKRLTANSFDTTAKTSAITNVGTSLNIIGDVNNDGKQDLIISHGSNPPILTTYLNDGTGRFPTNTPGVNGNNNEVLWAAGDLNNDGKADVLSTASSSGTSTLYYRLTQPDNSFGAPVPITTFTGFLTHAAYVDNFAAGITIEDLNNDGLKDIAFAAAPSYNLKVLTNTGSLSFTETLSTAYGQPVTSLKTVDLNNDSKKDFVSYAALGRIKIISNNGDNTFTDSEITVPAAYSQINYYTKDFFTADLDADGDQDVIVPGAKKYLVLRNDGSFNFTQQEYKGFQYVNAIENTDGDGKADMLSLVRPVLDGHYRLFSPNAVFYLYNAVKFKQNVCNRFGQTKIVDYDGDGFTDRAFWNPSTGVWRYYTDETNEVTFQWGLGALSDLPVPNDYDGDGLTDYAVFRKSTGTWWIYRSSDQQAFVLRFGITEDKPVPADYDGDGRADIAVFRTSTGDWHFWLSQTNSYGALHFGIAEDKPVPADYDGDGKADIAVFRPSTGVWYRLNSSDNSYSVMQYGISTDIPVPADYDGDGRANIAVYRDGQWYILKTDFSTSVFNWGSSGDNPFYGEDYESKVFVYRKTNSSIYLTNYPAGIYGFDRYSTGNSFNETLVSSILPPE